MRAGAIIVAAGQSSRMNGVDKLFLPLIGIPLIAHTLAAFEAAPSIQSIVLVLSQANVEQGKALVKQHGFAKVRQVCLGGESRQDSVRRGLEHLAPHTWVVIHDGARPCVEPELIERGLKEATRWESAVAAVPVKDTIKIVGDQGMVLETPDRQKLWAAQTPQVFPWDLLQKAYRQTGVDATDDAALVERMGHPVHIFLGSYANIKVTTREDVLMAETLLRRREGLAV
ncbi:MAG: 2-C-methyl-D-erythritol 4-phosphate cytidylyltransferase [Dehalococcoidia bacterium]|nr:2-C-methyl-D-erythritol 4-phosphate cytidylyltransferase [Dehalococcoidia bacterium]